jgi:WD40 repeat protein/tRNA A-37 threonylcarbamoyl transferase component Bud32
MLLVECPREDEILALLQDELSDARASEIREHAWDCAACGTLLAELVKGTAGGVAAGGAGPAEPRTLGRFRIERMIGRGGMGEVYLATDTTLDRQVALKLLRPRSASDPRVRARFEREARITARLQHPAIASLYQLERAENGEPFYVMRLVPGRSLANAIDAATNVSERLALLPHLLAVADAMSFAHGHQVIHRDLKPANVLIGEFGETVVVDWGLSKDLTAGADELATGGISAQAANSASESDQTVAGTVIGTPSYMSPEQAMGLAADARSDVYALGAILYEILAGAPPYRETTSKATIARVRSGPPMPLIERAADAPAALRAIVEKAMARDPGARYPSAREVAEELRRFETGQLVSVHRYTVGELVGRWVTRHRAAVAVGALAVAVLAATAASSVVAIVRARDRAQAARAAAESQALTLLEEEGRQALLDGHPLEAAALLGHAYASDQRPAIRVLLARAMGSFDSIARTFDHCEGLAAFSPDGRRVLTQMDLNSYLWDLQSGTLLATLSPHTDGLWSGAFSPDGTQVALGGRDETISLWDAQSGASLATITSGPVTDLSFSPDGNLIATAGGDHLRLWDAHSGKLVRELVGHTDWVPSAAFSPDGSRVLSGSADHTARIWDLHTGATLLTLVGHTNGVWHASYSPDGTRVVTASADRTARVWDAATGQALLSLEGHGGAVRDGEFSPDGQHLVTASLDGTARIWDAQTGRLLQILEADTDTVQAASFSPDGQWVLTGSWDGTAKLWRVGALGGSRVYPFATVVEHVAFSPDRARFAIGGGSGDAWIVDTASGAILTTLKGDGQSVLRVSFSPDGTRVLTTSGETTARLWDARTGEAGLVLQGAPGVVNDAEFSADGAHIVAGDDDGALWIWDSSSGTALLHLPGQGQRIDCARFSPDGQRFVTGGSNASANIRDAATGSILATLVGHNREVTDCVFSPDGKLVATASIDRTARTWDAASGVPLRSFVGHGDHLYGVAFSPDGEILATTGEDSAVKLWDVETGGLLDVLQGHTERSFNAQFGADDTTLLTSSSDQTARLWTIPMETRSPDTIASIIDAQVPYDLVDGRLVPREQPHP